MNAAMRPDRYGWFSRHRFAVDAMLAALFGLFSWATVVGISSTSIEAVADTATVIAMAAPLAWRRTRPVQAGAIIAAASLAQVAVGVQIQFANLAVPLVVYALSAYGPRWASLGGLGLGLVGAVLATARYGIDWSRSVSWTDAGMTLLLLAGSVLVAWLLGDMTRSRRQRVEALQARARQLEVERQQEREIAAADERARIARELHDVVAHSLSVMITQADGGRYAFAQEPERALQALEQIAVTGRQSLAEMRRLLGVLRTEDAETARPMPTLADVPDLVEAVRTSGLEVRLETVGRAPERGYPPGAELAVYRIVQEALTNVLKHAGPGARAAVTLTLDDRGIEVEVVDDGRGAASVPDGRGGGIRGMTERVELYGGQLSARPRPVGGFAVRATLPAAPGEATP